MNIFHRNIKIILSSSILQRELTLNSNDVQITVTAKKYLSHMKDETFIEIFNLNKDWISKLVNGKYDKVRCYAGYGGKYFLVSVNSILTITMDKQDLNTPKIKVLCSSKYQSRSKNSLTLKKGITLYEALSLVSIKLGIRSFIQESLRTKVTSKDYVMQNGNQIITQILRDNPSISISNDTGTLDLDLEFREIFGNQNKVITIKPENGTLIKDWIKFSTDLRISFTSLPIIEYKIGTIVEIDRDYINYSISMVEEQFLQRKKTLLVLDRFNQKNQGKDLFVIVGLEYKLDVRGSFQVEVTCRPYHTYQRRLIGGL